MNRDLQRQPHSQRAFTLIEIMIALMIFAIIGAIAATGLSTVLTAREHTRATAERLRQLQIAMAITSQDFGQIVNRAILDNPGTSLPPLITHQNYVEFTHGGVLNPFMTLPRSTLQRVAYTLRDHKFIRISWPVLDRAPDTQPIEQILLDHVETMQLRYLSDKNQFYDQWPPIGTTATNQNPLPKAIELTLTLQKWGVLQRLFLVGDGS